MCGIRLAVNSWMRLGDIISDPYRSERVFSPANADMRKCWYKQREYASSSILARINATRPTRRNRTLTDRLHMLRIVFSVVVSDLFEHLVDASLVQGSLFHLRSASLNPWGSTDR
jgi:hypothetical protein